MGVDFVNHLHLAAGPVEVFADHYIAFLIHLPCRCAQNHAVRHNRLQYLLDDSGNGRLHIGINLGQIPWVALLERGVVQHKQLRLLYAGRLAAAVFAIHRTGAAGRVAVRLGREIGGGAGIHAVLERIEAGPSCFLRRRVTFQILTHRRLAFRRLRTGGIRPTLH